MCSSARSRRAGPNVIVAVGLAAGDVAASRRLDARDGTRLLALMNMAMADSDIAGWKIRYVYRRATL